MRSTASQVVANTEAAARADTVALVVKPQDMGDVLTEIAPHLRAGQVLISLAAGITTDYIEKHIPDGIAVVRVMPNTPALVDEGMAAISPGTHCDEEHLALAEQMLSVTGRVVRVPEKQQDAVTAISGSGPAYLFFVVEAMIEAGVHLGLPRSTATELVVQTVVGSAKLLRETGSTRPCCASRSPRRAAPPPRRSASSRTTRSGRRSSPRWRPRATARSPSPPAMTEARPPEPTARTRRTPAWQAGAGLRPARPRSTRPCRSSSTTGWTRSSSTSGFFESVVRDYAHGHLPELPLTDTTNAALHFSPVLALLAPLVLVCVLADRPSWSRRRWRLPPASSR